MEYKTSKEETRYEIGPGTAGVAQRISPYESQEKVPEEEKGLFALMKNDVMPCSHNQY